MAQSNESNILHLGEILNDPSRPLKERFRALFSLKYVGGTEAINQIHACFKDKSALLKHELAYCLGQMQDPAAIDILTSVLEDKSQEPMVRHEAGEALGAIGNLSIIPLLEKYSKDPSPEIAETCQLAISRLNFIQCNADEKCLQKKKPYLTVDPAPPLQIMDVNRLEKILLDENESLFNRYRAMFTLRNIGEPQCIVALTKGLKAGSALFRHEIAFVLGQLQDRVAISALRESLEDTKENEMVRHECAEALGAIASPECYAILDKYINDSKTVVRESCIVALDICDYENSSHFQYAYIPTLPINT